MRKLHIDIETYCDLDLKKVGLDRYSAHPSFEIMLCAWSLAGGPERIWDVTSEPMPRALREAFDDSDVHVHAFNAQFERVCLKRGLGIDIGYERWRCTMVLAFMHSFAGTLDMIGKQMGIPEGSLKLQTGKRLIKMFCGPQRPTKAQPLKRRDALTDPDDWELFKGYCIGDVVAERAIDSRLDRPEYPIPDREWDFYALDQRINDIGLPIDRQFCVNALAMADRRKAELMVQMNALTGLGNSNSGTQLLPWLRARGYPFNDIGKDTVVKVLGDPSLDDALTDVCRQVLRLRQKAARTSTAKYKALLDAMGEDDRMRFVFQFAGAQRTARFAGRRFQPQNLTTMRNIEDVAVLSLLVDAIRADDYDYLCLLCAEPLDALAGLVRSAVRADDDEELVVCDLSSIESVVIGWVAKCERLLNVFRDGKDAYKDFATELFQVAYEDVTKDQRKKSKPATLGAGYRLGGGEVREGKKTGLWGYAENMGIAMTQVEARRGVATFRRVYKEIPQCWYDLERAIMQTIRDRTPSKVGAVKFRFRKPYLIAELPSGRCIYYHSPRVSKTPFEYTDSKTGERVRTIKDSISYMGKQQNGTAWVRIFSHGGKFIENLVQAIARDILRECLMALDAAGFNLIGHVHDEAIALEPKGGRTHQDMRLEMIRPIAWASKMPLNAAGHSGQFYRKD